MGVVTTEKMSQVPDCLNPTQDDIAKLVACESHTGSTNCDKEMTRYIFKKRGDGVNVFNLLKTWEKLVLAARVIAAVENPLDVCAISAGTYGQRAVLKYAHYTEWDVMIDMFIYRNPEDQEKEEAEQEDSFAAQGFGPETIEGEDNWSGNAAPADWGATGAAGGDWGEQGAGNDSWADASATTASWD